MLANYHTHTYLCHHASGTPEEYVEKAIERGLKILGFSDHVPMPYSKPDYVSRARMTLQETEVYVNTVLGLKEKYKDDITIYLGYEAEYLPREFENMLKHVTSYPIDYLILGQHFSNNEYDGQYFGSPFLKEKAVRQIPRCRRPPEEICPDRDSLSPASAQSMILLLRNLNRSFRTASM